MARYTGPKNKLARQLSQDLGLKSNPLKVARRLNVLPGMHGRKMRRKTSDYGRQLLEKQKLRFAYGVQEKYLRQLYGRSHEDPFRYRSGPAKTIGTPPGQCCLSLGFCAQPAPLPAS